jgi:hypothetical protein
MADVIARMRSEMEERLKAIEAELASAEALIAEKARLEHALATPVFANARTAPEPVSLVRRPPA